MEIFTWRTRSRVQTHHRNIWNFLKSIPGYTLSKEISRQPVSISKGCTGVKKWFLCWRLTKWNFNTRKCNQDAARNIIFPENSRTHIEKMGMQQLNIFKYNSKRAARHTVNTVTGQWRWSYNTRIIMESKTWSTSSQEQHYPAANDRLHEYKTQDASHNSIHIWSSWTPKSTCHCLQIFLQKLCQDKLQWDELLPVHLQQEWNQLHQTIPNLSQIKINRKVVCSNATNIQIHGFCDSSERA